MNALRILEVSWLVLGLAGVLLCAYNLINEGPVSAIWPFLFTVIAAVFYNVRRKQRIAYERHQDNNSTENQ